MLMPMMGFFLMLIVVGGLGSLVAIADSTRARLLPFTLAMLLSGLGVYLVGFGLAYLAEIISDSASTDSSVFFILGILTGAIGGAICGLVLGIRRNRRMAA